jgi:transposase
VGVDLPKTIEACHELIRQLLLVIERQQAEIEELKVEVAELRAKLNQNSQNSSRPPSSDGFNKPNPKPAFTKKKKRRGGQLGHRGKTLKRVENPDVVIDCEPLDCVCGKGQWIDKVEIIEARQVFELPDPRLEVLEYRRIKRVCRCGLTNCGEFPEKVVAPVQYGEKVQTLVTLLSVHGCLSYRKIGQLFADIYGYQLNAATAQEMVKRTAQVMPMEEIKAGIVESEVAHFDETGIRENGKLKWIHNASTEKLTYQFVHEKRGKEAMRSENSVLPKYQGVAIHDCLESYFGFTGFKHGTCNSHILRELNGIIENNESKWGASMKKLMLKMYVESEFGGGLPNASKRSNNIV